jgi:hypothetical protein
MRIIIAILIWVAAASLAPAAITVTPGGGGGVITTNEFDGSAITSGTVADARIASTIARDSEVPAIIATNNAAGATNSPAGYPLQDTSQSYFGVWDDYPNGLTVGYNAYVTVGTLFGQRRITASFAGANGVQLGTPAPFYQDGKYYFAFMTKGYPVSGSNLTNNLGIYVSDDLSNWRLHCYVDCSSPSPAEVNPVNNVWAPEWFVDTDGSIYLIANIGTNLTSSAANMKVYGIKALSSDLLTWSNPTNFAGVPSSVFDGFVTKSNGTYMVWYRNAGTSYNEIYTSTNLFSGYTAFKTGNWAGWGADYEAFQPIQLPNGTWYIQFTHTAPFDGTYVSTSTNFVNWTTPVRMKQSLTQGHGSLWPMPSGTISYEMVQAVRPALSNSTYGVQYLLGPFTAEQPANQSFVVWSGGTYTSVALASSNATQLVTDGFSRSIPFYLSRRIGAGYDIAYNSGANNDMRWYGQILSSTTGNTNAVPVFGPTGNLTNAVIDVANTTNGVAGRLQIPGTSYYVMVFTNTP